MATEEVKKRRQDYGSIVTLIEKKDEGRLKLKI